MNYRTQTQNKTHKIRKIIVNNIISNKKEYLIITIIFIIGLLVGVMFINNIKEQQFTNLNGYLNDFIEELKNAESIDVFSTLKDSIFQNLGTVFTICFFGTTVIGIPVVFGVILYKGFCLGYTISSCIGVFGVGKGLAFIFSELFLQNLLVIPVIIAVAVSGFKLYKSIIKDKRKENIKLEIIRHLMFCLIMSIVAIVASLIEIFISNNILAIIVKYF